MEWKKERPITSGEYFRTTLWGKMIQCTIHDFSFLKGRGLEMASTNASGHHAYPIEKTPKDWYWFGPIPKPPKDADWVSRQRMNEN